MYEAILSGYILYLLNCRCFVGEYRIDDRFQEVSQLRGVSLIPSGNIFSLRPDENIPRGQEPTIMCHRNQQKYEGMLFQKPY